MKVCIVKVEQVTDEKNSFATEFLKNIRRESKEYVTEEEIKNNAQFEKAKAIKTVLTNLLNLETINTNNKNDIDQKTFDQYVLMAEQIDTCFINLLEEYFEDCECEDECDCVNCDNDCDNCDCPCCSDNNFDAKDDSNESKFIMDLFTLLEMFKPVFNMDNITDEQEINISMTGEEYKKIKNIVDSYEIDSDEESDT